MTGFIFKHSQYSYTNIWNNCNIMFPIRLFIWYLNLKSHKKNSNGHHFLWSHCLLSIVIMIIQKERTIKYGMKTDNYIYHHQKNNTRFLFISLKYFDENILHQRWYAYLHFTIQKKSFRVFKQKLAENYQFILTAK